jgi:hypothetical protein
MGAYLKLMIFAAAIGLLAIPSSAQAVLIELKKGVAKPSLKNSSVTAQKAPANAAPLNNESLAAAIKSAKPQSKPSIPQQTGEFVTLTARQTFIANKASLSVSGDISFNTEGATNYINLGSPTVGGAAKANFIGLSPAQTYVVDVVVDIHYPETHIYLTGPEGSQSIRFDKTGTQHLLMLITGQQSTYLSLNPSNWISFMSCKVSRLDK